MGKGLKYFFFPALCSLFSCLTQPTIWAADSRTNTPLDKRIAEKVDKAVQDQTEKRLQKIGETFLQKLLSKTNTLVKDSFRVAVNEAMRETTREQLLGDDFQKELATSDMPFFGNKDGKIVVLMMTDPYCHFCPDTLVTYKRYAKKNKNLKVILHSLPLGGKFSYLATRALLLAHIKYNKFDALNEAIHKEFKRTKSFLSLEALQKQAESVGIPPSNFKEAIQSTEVTKRLQQTLLISQKFAISATPSFIVLGPKPKVEEGVLPPQELLD